MKKIFTLLLLATLLLKVHAVPENNPPTCPPHSWTEMDPEVNPSCTINISVTDNAIYTPLGIGANVSATDSSTAGTTFEKQKCTECNIEEILSTTTHSISWSWTQGGNSGSGLSYSTGPSTPAGEYNVTFKSECQDSRCGKSGTASASIKVIEVKSISAGGIISNTNSPNTNETIYVGKGSENITVTATPNPTGGWPANYPTWKIGTTPVGSPGSTTYSFAPTNTGLHIISANCGNSKAIKIMVVQITHNGTDVTKGSGNSKSRVVGQYNSLTISSVDAGNTAAPTISWSIPGDHIKSWNIDDDQTRSYTQDLTTTDLTSATLPTFYWYKAATSLRPSVTITSGTSSSTIESELFTITKPTINVTTQTGNIDVDKNYLYNLGTWYIHYGSHSSLGGTEGLKIEHNDSFSPVGITQWVQLCQGYRRRKRISDGKMERVDLLGLDVIYPYSSLDYAVDSPAVNLEYNSDISEVIVNDSFEMYLMYKPMPLTESIYVPISVTTWGWSGTATKDQSNWVLSGDSKTTPSTVNATDYPKWTEIVDPGNWILEPGQ